MASGKVVLSTNVGGVSDVIINESGFICNSVSSDFVSPILNLINNPNLYNFISNNARESVRSRFHYHTLCQNMALQYLNLLNHKL
jgi:glycosyltransferase involved in cell wall biosynthesis